MDELDFEILLGKVNGIESEVIHLRKVVETFTDRLDDMAALDSILENARSKQINPSSINPRDHRIMGKKK